MRPSLLSRAARTPKTGTGRHVIPAPRNGRALPYFIVLPVSICQRSYSQKPHTAGKECGE